MYKILILAAAIFLPLLSGSAGALKLPAPVFSRGSQFVDGSADLLVKHFNYYTPSVSFRDVPAEPGAYYEITAKVFPLNTKRFNAFYVQIAFSGIKEKHHTESIELKSAVPKEIRYVFQVPEQCRDRRMTLRLFSRVTSKAGVICRDFAIRRIPRPASKKIDILCPAYRNSIYHSLPVKEISGKVAVYPQPAKIRVSLLRDGKVLAASAGAGFSFKNADKLPDGDYIVKADLLKKDGKVYDQISTVIRKLPPSPNEVVVGQDANLYINGRIFYPVMFFDSGLTPSLLKTAYDRGINLSLCYKKTTAEILKELDHAAANQAKMILQINFDDPDTAHYRRRVLRIVTPEVLRHPALLGYLIKDEPEIKGEPLAPLAAAAAEWRRIDPYRPLYLNAAPHGSVQQHREYSSIVDIYGMDIYPVGRWNHGSIGNVKSLTCVGTCMKVCVDAVEDRKPIIACLQAYSWNKVKPVYPDLTQSRFMTYDSFFNGVRGASYYGVDRIYSRDFIPVLFRTVDELKHITPVFVSGKRLFSTSGDIRTIAISFKGRRYLFAANYTNRTVQGKLRTPFTVKTVPVWFENRSVQIVSGQIRDTFAPFAVHVYCDGAAPVLPKVVPKDWLAAVKKPHPAAPGRKTEKLSAGYPAANWIWAAGQEKVMGSEVWLVKKFDLTKPVSLAVLTIAADNDGEVYIDGELVGKCGRWHRAAKLNVLKYLSPGEHLLAVKVRDIGACGGLAAELGVLFFSGNNLFITTDAGWGALPSNKVRGIPKLGDEKKFPAASVLSPLGKGKWGNRVKWPARGF